VVSTSVIVLVQVAAILTGHVVGVFIAHDRAIADYTRPGSASAPSTRCWWSWSSTPWAASPCCSGP
jgi:hypothetical protein